MTRPPTRTQKNPAIPVVVLMTDDAENRRRAEADGIKCVSGKSHYCSRLPPNLTYSIVRRYVEGSKDSDKLLDLLAASGENDVEPTPASAAGRAQLYPDVCIYSTLVSVLDAKE